MSAQPDTPESQDDDALRTLGDLLYADSTKTRIAESEWVSLVGFMAAGDQSALRALYERTHRIVFTLVLRITSNRATAEELTVDVFHDVWRRASQYDPADGSVIGWIMNQARSRAIDRLRLEGRKKRVNPYIEESTAITSANDFEDAVAAKQSGPVLRTALEAVSPEERQAIETAFFLELSYAEVATRLNQPVGTIKTRIRSGLMKLRRVLGRDGYEP